MVAEASSHHKAAIGIDWHVHAAALFDGRALVIKIINWNRSASYLGSNEANQMTDYCWTYYNIFNDFNDDNNNTDDDENNNNNNGNNNNNKNKKKNNNNNNIDMTTSRLTSDVHMDRTGRDSESQVREEDLALVVTPVFVTDIVQCKDVMALAKVTVVPEDVASAGHKLFEADTEIFLVTINTADLALQLNLVAVRVECLVGNQFGSHLAWLLLLVIVFFFGWSCEI